MLQIVVHNGYSLDLPEDFTLSIVDENPLFLEDRIPTPYSVQFEVPSTAKNLQIFGLPNRIASNGLKKRLPADVIHFGFIIARGEILLTGAIENPKLQFVGSVTPEDVAKRLNDLDLEEYDYGDFPLIADQIDYSQSWADLYNASMLAAAQQGNPFVVAPIKINGRVWEGEEVEEGAKNTLMNYMNYYNPYHGNFTIEHNPRTHSPIIPAIYLKDIIQAAFGDALTDNPFAVGDFAKLVLPAFNHKYFTYENLRGYYYEHDLTPVLFFNPLVDDYDYHGTEWRDLSIRMKSFQQAYLFTDLLKNIFKMFSMTMFRGNNFSIEKNDDIMSRDVIINWDDKIVGIPEKTYEAGKDYIFKYSDSSSTITTNILKFANMYAIYSYIYEYGLENTDYNVKDESTGAIYKINKISVENALGAKIVFRTEVLESSLTTLVNESEKEKYEVASEITPLEVYIESYWYLEKPIASGEWAVPHIDLDDLKSPPHIMFYAGMAKVFDSINTYPLLLGHNYDLFGIKLFDFSLNPGGSDGLLAKFHGKFKAWVEKDKLCLKATVKLTPAELRNLNFRDKYHIGGKLFYNRKNEYQLTHHSISLVEADLIEC